MWTTFLPQGVEIELIFALRTAVSKIRADFQNCHIWAWNLEFEKKCRKLHMDLLSTPGDRNFRCTGSRFLDRAISSLN